MKNKSFFKIEFLCKQIVWLEQKFITITYVNAFNTTDIYDIATAADIIGVLQNK